MNKVFSNKCPFSPLFSNHFFTRGKIPNIPLYHYTNIFHTGTHPTFLKQFFFFVIVIFPLSGRLKCLPLCKFVLPSLSLPFHVTVCSPKHKHTRVMRKSERMRRSSRHDVRLPQFTLVLLLCTTTLSQKLYKEPVFLKISF